MGPCHGALVPLPSPFVQLSIRNDKGTGTIQLPSQQTLRDYTYHTKAVVGLSAEVDQDLSTVAKLPSCMERDKCVIIIFNEMHLCQDLTFDKHRVQ